MHIVIVKAQYIFYSTHCVTVHCVGVCVCIMAQALWHLLQTKAYFKKSFEKN